MLDGFDNVLAHWSSMSALGSWVDAHGDIYLAPNVERIVYKQIRQG